MADSSYILPALITAAILCGLRARIDVYEAFVRGAKEGLTTLVTMAPYLCAILTAVSLLRSAGVMDRLEAWLAPVLSFLGLPPQTAGVVLLRPLSGSAALGVVQDVLAAAGADSRAGRLACVICGASETVFFTGPLYLGAAGVGRSRWAIPAAMAAYVSGVLAAAALVRA